MGYNWNEVFASARHTIWRPGEMLSIAGSRHVEESGWLIEGHDHEGAINIPVEYVFPHLSGLSGPPLEFVSTGWAFSTSKTRAIERSLLEVVERDLLMRFWHGLPPVMRQLQFTSPDFDWINELEESSKVVGVCCTVTVSEGSLKGYFCILAVVGNEPPYLTTGQALELSPASAIEKAWRELVMLRMHQYDCILRGEAEGVKNSFQRNYLQAAYMPKAGDQLVGLVEANVGEDKRKGNLNYAANRRAWICLKPPPWVRRKCVVTKVWIEDCQPMLPGGLVSEPVPAWQALGVSKADLANCGWHPFP